MQEEINVALALADMPDGTKRVKLMILGGELQFFLFLSAAEAEATGKAMQNVSIRQELTSSSRPAPRSTPKTHVTQRI